VKIRKRFLPYYPTDCAQYDYVEPFVGLGSVAYQAITLLPFRSYSLSDAFAWPVGLLQAVLGDRTDWGRIEDRIDEARGRLLHEKREQIALEFERLKLPCRQGDYFAYAFLLQYAKGIFVYPDRPDTASFYPRNVGNGLRLLRRERVLHWRQILSHATIRQADAFEVLRGLDGSSFCYLDPTYFHHTAYRDSPDFRMYGQELSMGGHEELRDLLKAATFPWMMSLGQHRLTTEWYCRNKSYRAIPIPYAGTMRRSGAPPATKYHEWLIVS